MRITPHVGDIVDVRSDKGTVTNAPWEKKVVKVVGRDTYFSDGEAHRLNNRNLMRVTLNDAGNRLFTYSH